MKRKKTCRKASPYLFIAPHFLLFVAFAAFPTLYSMYISLCKWNFIGEPRFVGLENYQNLLLRSDSAFYREFMNALKNNIMYVLTAVPLLVVIPLLIAVALDTKPKGAKIFQAAFFIPCLFSVSTVALMWRWAFDRNFGFINRLFGLDIAWVTDEPYFWIAVILMGIWWSIGGNLIIFLAGIADIPKNLYEAAALDGANAIQKLIYITLPGLRNQILYTLVITIISAFKIYGEVLMFSGSTSRPTMDKNVLVISIQQMAFGESSNAGMASAMAVMLSFIIVAFSVFSFNLRLERKERRPRHKWRKN